MRDSELDRIVGLECRDCPLSGSTKPIKPHDPKERWNGIVVVGEAPGSEEESRGKPFVGPAGIILRKVFKKEAGINLDHCFVTNCLLCRPPKNRNPKAAEIKECFPSVISKIDELTPKLIVAVGNFALKALTGKMGITKYNGTILETNQSAGVNMTGGYKVIPIIHPTAVKHNPRVMGEFVMGISHIPRFLTGQLVEPKDVGKYEFITDINRAKQVLRRISADGGLTVPLAVAMDLETNGLEWARQSTHIKSIGISYEDRRAFTIDFRTWTALELQEILQELRKILASKKILKVFHNAKFDMNFLHMKYGLETKPPIFDTKVGQYLCNELIPNDLKTMAWQFTRLGGFERGYTTDKVVDLDGAELHDYNAKDADITLRCYRELDKELEAENVKPVFHDLLMPVQFPLADMERRGIRIDLKKFEWLENQTETVFNAVVREMEKHDAVKSYTKTKGKFNPSSTIDLRWVVYSSLGMPILKKTPTGAPSVDRETMNGLAGRDPLIDLIIEYKEVQKVKSTYIEGLKDKIVDGRVHTQYLTHVARSGRTASSKPNLQNLPIVKEGSVMEKYNLRIRDMFVPDHGCEFDEVDYDQHELRIMCIASQDPVMKHIFTSGLDIHKETARGCFGTNNVTDGMRRQAKIINFGILYGMGYARLAGQLGISLEESRGYIRRFFAKYWKVRMWQGEMERFVRKNGYIETLTGRKRRFPGIDGVLSNDDIRQALNTPIQGTASDLLLYSIIGISKMFKHYKMKSSLCAQVHDSLLINVFKGEREQVRDICHNVMLKPPVDFELYVPLKIDFKAGMSWGSLHGENKKEDTVEATA